MNKSESIAKLAEALSKAQGAMKNAVKDSANPFFKSRYADLASVSDACRADLAANGLAVVQLPMMRDGKMVLEYVLMHSSGEWISSELEMTPVKSDPQGIGSAITYARRYTLASIAGVATEDDDGNAASGKNGQSETKKEPVSFKRSAAIGKDEGGNHQEGHPPVAADIVTKEHLEFAKQQAEGATNVYTPPEPIEYCTKEQQDWLRMQFKEKLPAKFRKNSEELRKDWLKLNNYVKDDKGTSTMIPRQEFKVIAKRIIEYADTFSL